VDGTALDTILLNYSALATCEHRIAPTTFEIFSFAPTARPGNAFTSLERLKDNLRPRSDQAHNRAIRWVAPTNQPKTPATCPHELEPGLLLGVASQYALCRMFRPVHGASTIPFSAPSIHAVATITTFSELILICVLGQKLKAPASTSPYNTAHTDIRSCNINCSGGLLDVTRSYHCAEARRE